MEPISPLFRDINQHRPSDVLGICPEALDIDGAFTETKRSALLAAPKVFNLLVGAGSFLATDGWLAG